MGLFVYMKYFSYLCTIIIKERRNIMKTKSAYISVINSKIEETRKEFKRYCDMANDNSTFEYDQEVNFYNCLKTHFESMMKLQFKLIELLRMKSMIEYGLREPKDVIEIISSRYKDELLSYRLMQSSTNVIHNLASVWENEVKQELLKFYKIV